MASCEKQDSPLLLLPVEILEAVVKIPSLDHVDICHLASACKHLARVCRSNEIWRCKLEQRWPKCFARLSGLNNVDWHHVFRNRLMVHRKTRKALREISVEYYKNKEVPDEGFREFDMMIEVEHLSIEDVMEEIWSILHNEDSNKNLCMKFYGHKAARYVRHLQLTPKWTGLLEQPPEEQSLETGVILLAQWCQPSEDIDSTAITEQLDRIADMVRQELSSKHPKHPLCCAAPGSEVRMQSEQERQVLLCINFVLFCKLGFAGDKEDYYRRRNSYINQVLLRMKGIPITLCVLYQSVARRLGVKCEPVNCPQHFLLRWKENPLHLPDEQYTYIDCFEKGRFMKRKEVHPTLKLNAEFVKPDSLESTVPRRVFERMLRNLVAIGRHQSQEGMGLIDLRNTLDLFLLVSPHEFEIRILQARLLLHFSINLPYVMESLQKMAALDTHRQLLISHLQNETQVLMRNLKAEKEQQSVVVKRRADHDNKFSVGLVMKHKRYNYLCVIGGWDPKCLASNEWITQMGVDRLPRGRKQPFYNVLVDDASDRYAAEENLLFTLEAKPINHPDIGRYFDEFVDGHYIPNSRKQESYPDDHQETLRLLEAFRSGQISSELCAD